VFRGGALLYIVRKVSYMVTENILTKYGFVNEKDYSKLIEIIRNTTRLIEVHIDTYPNNPLVCSDSHMLLLRTSEKRARILVEDDRLIFKRDDAYGTHFVNVLISKIKECFTKMTGDCDEYILNVQNIYYRITIIN
jgi:hypothetical protein